MDTILIFVHVAIAIALIALVLIQQGKGADMGAAFGSGASQTVFGSQGSGSFMTRSTAILATVFFVTSLTLAYFSGQSNTSESVIDVIESPATLDTDLPVSVPGDMPAVPNESPVSDLPPE